MMADEADKLSPGTQTSQRDNRTPEDVPVQYVPVCPICNQMIKKSQDEDINMQVEKHILSGCKSLVVGKPETSYTWPWETCRQHDGVWPGCRRNPCISPDLCTPGSYGCPRFTSPGVGCRRGPMPSGCFGCRRNRCRWHRRACCT